MNTDREDSERPSGVEPGDDPAPTAPGPDAHRIRSQELFEFAPDCQLVTDRRGVILEANHAAAVLFRCRKEFLIDKPLGLFVVPGMRRRFYQGLAQLALLSASDEFELKVGWTDEPRDVAIRAAAAEGGPDGERNLRWQVRDVSETRRAEAARSDLLQRLVTVLEGERRRIARELHDEMGQHITAMILDLKLLGDTLPADSPAREGLERVRRAAGQIGQAIHRVAIELRPTSLDDLGLDTTLRTHVDDWSRRTGIRAEYCGFGPIGWSRPPGVETTLFRSVQEALTNIAKHAEATRASVILVGRDDSIRLVVEDNGRGFDVDSAMKPDGGAERLGLLGMRERVAMAGGSLDIESGPGGPTTIFIQIPIPRDGGPPAHG